MAWYGVHVLLVVEFKDGQQTTYPAWDNVYLVQAADGDEAAQKGEAIGKLNEGDARGTFLWDERPATWVSRGVRKIVDVFNPSSVGNGVGSGIEVPYQTLEFKSRTDLEAFLKGDPVNSMIID